jgi:hypothetical protein
MPPATHEPDPLADDRAPGRDPGRSSTSSRPPMRVPRPRRGHQAGPASTDGGGAGPRPIATRSARTVRSACPPRPPVGPARRPRRRQRLKILQLAAVEGTGGPTAETVTASLPAARDDGVVITATTDPRRARSRHVPRGHRDGGGAAHQVAFAPPADEEPPTARQRSARASRTRRVRAVRIGLTGPGEHWHVIDPRTRRPDEGWLSLVLVGLMTLSSRRRSTTRLGARPGPHRAWCGWRSGSRSG